MEVWKEAKIDAQMATLIRDVSFLCGRIQTLQDVLAAVVKTHPDPQKLRVILGAYNPKPLPNQAALQGQQQAWQELKTAFPSKEPTE